MRRRNVITLILLLLLIPAVVVAGAVLFREKYYAWIALSVAILSVLPLFYAFERKESSSKELTVLAVMVALSAAGRFVFAWLPGFKPVTAITVIAAMWLGKEVGFVIGSLSAVLSNFYFVQGPWTPFQMFAWGMIGLLSGCLWRVLQRSRIALSVFGALAGVLFSLVMDVFSTLWADGVFNASRYAASLITALPVMAQYAVSNVVFLLLLAKPIGEKLARIRRKYGLFVSHGCDRSDKQ